MAPASLAQAHSFKGSCPWLPLKAFSMSFSVLSCAGSKGGQPYRPVLHPSLHCTYAIFGRYLAYHNPFVHYKTCIVFFSWLNMLGHDLLRLAPLVLLYHVPLQSIHVLTPLQLRPLLGVSGHNYFHQHCLLASLVLPDLRLSSTRVQRSMLFQTDQLMID